MIRRRGSSLPTRIVNLAAAALVAVVVLYLAGHGTGGIPPLGATFVPGTGVWTVAADAQLPTNQTLHLHGMQHTARVVFEPTGTAHISAATDHDLWLVNGYLHARFRLFQLDLLRRLGEGRLSQVVGSAALSSDKFELKLGLLRTATAEWRQMGPNDPAHATLIAYSKGVNDGIAELERNHTLPLLFKLLNYTPARWTPIDTLVVQGDETQDLDFTKEPLDYAALVRTLGYARTMHWFPVIAPDTQQPYDRGPYHRGSPAPLPAQLSASGQVAELITHLEADPSALPSGLLAGGGNSNNWAVDGSKTASGKPLMANDPHLHLTLPSIWYQLSGDSPDYHFNGVGIPGTPGIIIGHNRHISWGETNVQNQVTFYYLETVDKRHHLYRWHGAWHPMRRITYHIPIKGGGSVRYEVDLTDHGPLTSYRRVPGRSIAIWWAGALPSPDLDVLQAIMRAPDFTAFRNALRGWHAPSQNFVYADENGNIGLISAGYYPIVARGAPWLPLPGDGSADVIGAIPFDDIPQIYDPPTHFVFSANQRPVTGAYPWYIGTSLASFDAGYRADRIQRFLAGHNHLTVAVMQDLQTDIHDYLAQLIVPRLLGALGRAAESPAERTARTLLARWDGSMRANSPAAAIWWTFWQQYLRDTFQPWWNAAHVPAQKFPSLRITVDLTSLDEDLEQWTLHDPGNSAFSLPTGARRTAPEVMSRAFAEAVSQLTNSLGSDPTQWQWGRLHRRKLDSLTQIPSLAYGPIASGGDKWTVSAAGGSTSTGGPSWRFIMNWATAQGEGIYPGGQSENPVSAWYRNGVSIWLAGDYRPMRGYLAARAERGSVTWTIES